MQGGVFVRWERQGKNLTGQSFVTHLAPTPTWTPEKALTLKYRAFTFTKFQYFSLNFYKFDPQRRELGGFRAGEVQITVVLSISKII